MKKVVIFGGSGIGMIAASIINQMKDTEVMGFLNDTIKNGELIGKYKKFEVIGDSADYLDFLEDDEVYFFIAYVGLENEKETYLKIKELKIPNNRFINLVDDRAILPENFTKIGKGVMMAALAQLSPDVTISDNCILLANSFVGHDSFLDHFAHVATNAVVGANVHIGKGVHVGSNSTIKEKVRIGDYSLIGSGSVVIKDVPSNCIVVGNPARILRYRNLK